MKFDKLLAGKVRAAVRDCTQQRQQYAEDLISEWETACVLSSGQDPNRNEHWERIARVRKGYLMAMVSER